MSSNPGFNYRIAEYHDIPALVEMRIQFSLELAGEQSSESIAENRKHLLEYFKKAMPEQQCINILAFSGNQMVGIGSGIINQRPGSFYNPSGKWCYVMNMYTIPAFRGQGICKEILNRITETCRNRGISAFELHATPAGARVYEKSGFHKHSEPTYRKFTD